MCFILKTTFQLINNLYLNRCDRKQSGDVEMDFALIRQDLKDVETSLVVVDLFKYSLVSICFHIRSRTNVTLNCLRQKIKSIGKHENILSKAIATLHVLKTGKTHVTSKAIIVWIYQF